MPAGQAVSWSFRDSKNQVGILHAFLVGTFGDPADGPATMTAMKTAFQALSNATVSANQYLPVAAPVQGSTADYSTVEDKAVLVFQTASGAIHKYQIPAPKASIFLADDETVDFTNGAVVTVVTDIVNGFVTRDGVALASSVGGYRRRGPAQRRFNIRTRNPLTTGQGI